MREPRRLTLVTPPTAAPVALPEVKAALKLEDDQTDDDAVLAGLIRVAAEECEKFTGRALMSQTWQLFLDAWPGDDSEALWEGLREGPETWLQGKPAAIELPKPPLQSVSHVKAYDDSDVGTAWAASNYFVDAATEPGRIVPRTGAAAPTITRTANGLEVQFVAGYGAAPHDVPEALRQGMVEMVKAIYDGCDDTAEAMKQSRAGVLWQSFRVVRI